MPVVKPANETARLAALERYALLDTEPEESFDDLTRLASFICKTPVAMISLVDDTRQWFKSRVGLAASETPREVAFCSYRHFAIRSSSLFPMRCKTSDSAIILSSSPPPTSAFMRERHSSMKTALRLARSASSIKRRANYRPSKKKRLRR